ncbi:MAG: CTP synthase, partial [Atopobiaceae bacterium]|nr:CTP synthase [Atopobiaceae bacterium]
MLQTKLVFVTGGVVSSLGKGITAAALGRLLKARGYSVSILKLDPYLNVDPGTMNPYQHGEVFVTDDGAETDLDIGHYERFINEDLTRLNNTTSGQIYSTVIDRERRGGYNGGTVQVIPHITDEIKNRIMKVAKKLRPDVLIVEIGGTVGDIESQPFLEAIRQLKAQCDPGQCCFIHVTLVPYLAASGELKTKPTQHSVKELQGLGIQPDVIVLRSDYPLNKGIKSKIALFCNTPEEFVIENLNARSLYEVPLLLEENGLCTAVLKRLLLEQREPDLKEWRVMVERELNPKHECTIAMVGKYTELHDAYLSVVEALKHGGFANEAKVNIKWIGSETLEQPDADVNAAFDDVDGILVPGGFGERGIKGMMVACRYARENKVPYFGICLGMQIAVIEFAQDVIGWKDAQSTEVDFATKHPVIDLMADQGKNLERIGGTLRLGSYTCRL